MQNPSNSLFLWKELFHEVREHPTKMKRLQICCLLIGFGVIHEFVRRRKKVTSESGS